MTNSHNTRTPQQRRPLDETTHRSAPPSAARDATDPRTRRARPVNERNEPVRRGADRGADRSASREDGRNVRSQDASDTRSPSRHKPWENRRDTRDDRNDGQRDDRRDSRSDGQRDDRPEHQRSQGRPDRPTGERGLSANRGADRGADRGASREDSRNTRSPDTSDSRSTSRHKPWENRRDTRDTRDDQRDGQRDDRRDSRRDGQRDDRPDHQRSQGRPDRPTGERGLSANRGTDRGADRSASREDSRNVRSPDSSDSRSTSRQKPWENRRDSSSRDSSHSRDTRDQGDQKSGHNPDDVQERQPAGRGNPAARGPARVGGRPPTHQSRRDRPVVDRTVDQREHLLRSTLETEHQNDEEMDQADADAWQQVTWFAISEYQAGQRLDNFLINRLKGVPKTRIYRLIREGEVRVNKGRVRADTRLVLGDQVRVAPIRRHVHNDKTAPVIGEELAAGLAARVIFEDDGLIILNKPAGIAVHGGSGVPFGVIEALRQALGKSYLELVHRIDRDTSGLLMISKKRSTLKRLQDDLRDGRIRKTYTALLKGHVLLDKQTVDAPLLRHELPNGERRVRVSNEGKASQTVFVVKERLGSATLVEASPLTGRTHQIRVHGLSIGHPLVGDDKYGHERIYGGPQPRRLCLHATRLQIPSYEQVFEAPLPDDLSELLTQLREHAKDAKPVKGKVPKAHDAVWHPDLGI